MPNYQFLFSESKRYFAKVFERTVFFEFACLTQTTVIDAPPLDPRGAASITPNLFLSLLLLPLTKMRFRGILMATLKRSLPAQQQQNNKKNAMLEILKKIEKIGSAALRKFSPMLLS